MELTTLWTSAAVLHAAFAMAALVLILAVAGRARAAGSGGVLVLAMLGMLAAFFICASADAWRHSLGPVRQTPWALAAAICGNAVAAIGLHFFFRNIRPMAELIAWSQWGSTALTIYAYAELAFYVFQVHRAGWDPAFLDKGVSNFRPLVWFALGPLLFTRQQLRAGTGLALTELDLSGFGTPPVPETTVARLRLIATASLPAVLVQLTSFLADAPWTAGTIALHTGLQLAMLPGIAGAIYYQTRAAFFDTALKRAALLALLCIGALVLVNAVPLGAAFGISALAGAFLVTLLHERIGAFLDRTVFRRPDYARLAPRITAALATAADPATTAVRELTEALRAEWVRFGESPDPEAEAVLDVASAARRWGAFSLGPRHRGMRYQSEDAAFISAIAAQLAAVLEGRESAAVETRALRARINPHFLFNSLNSLAAMVRDPSAERIVLDLARVFRHALETTAASTLPLSEEIAFLRAYLSIEQTRFEERLRFEIDCPPELLDTPVPPMLVQPLVENSIRHGISPKVEGGAVRVGIDRDGRRLRVTVSDTGVGFDAAAKPSPGIGVENVRRRVESLPGGRFLIESKPGEGTRAVLEWEVA